MNPSPHELFAAYLQCRFRLGEREWVLSPRAVAALRLYRRPGTTVSADAQPRRVSAVPASAKPPTPSSPRMAGGSLRSQETSRAPSSIPVVAPLSRLVLPEGDKPARLAFLAEALRQDSQCRMLFQRSKNMVFGVGSPDASILFVGEAPGVEDDAQGEPFVGPEGQLLTKMIQAMGLQRSQVYIASVCKFLPDMPVGANGNRKPTTAEMAACLPFLQAQIAVIAPRAIVVLGATAVEGLFAMPQALIMKMRGTWMEWEGIPVMPTYHPAYLLRNGTQSDKRKVWEDLMQVMDKTGLPIDEKQRNFFRRASSGS